MRHKSRVPAVALPLPDCPAVVIRYVQAANPNQVSSCEWESVPLIQLGADTALTRVIRRVRQGTLITFRISDPRGKVVATEKNRVPSVGRFLIGVSAGRGDYHRAEPVSNSPTQHVFRVTIPRQVPVRLFIDSDLIVRDASGLRVETRRATTMQIVPAGRDAVDLDLAVE